MPTVNLSEISPGDLARAKAIADRAHVNLRNCYQCGKCSAGCPMADDMDLRPQQVIRLLQLGQVEDALKARSPWICAQCSVCSSRCPQDIEIADLMREVRRESHASGYRRVPESDVFESTFIKKVRAHGVSNEQYLAASYNVKSGHLFQDFQSVPAMFSKKLIGIKMKSTRNPDAVAAMIDRCEQSTKAAREQQNAQGGE